MANLVIIKISLSGLQRLFRAFNMEGNYVPQPDSHMVLAVLTTICCCLPLGIVAIIKASKVNEFYSLKQYDAALAASNEAKKWSLIGIALGAVSYIGYILCYGFSLLPIFAFL